MRKEEGAELLRSLGAEYVVVTSKWTFDHWYYDGLGHYYYDGQNDADDHHYHGDDDRDKDGIWIMNILNRTQFFWLSIMQGWVERGAEGVDFKTEHFRRFWRDCWRDDQDYNGGNTNISSSTSLFCQKTPDLSDG